MRTHVHNKNVEEYYHKDINLHMHSAAAAGFIHPGTPAALRRFFPPTKSCHTDSKDLPLDSFPFHAITSESTASFSQASVTTGGKIFVHAGR